MAERQRASRHTAQPRGLDPPPGGSTAEECARTALEMGGKCTSQYDQSGYVGKYNKYAPQILLMARRILRDYHEAEDALQQAAIKLHAYWVKDPDHVEDDSGFAYSILVSGILDYVRKRLKEIQRTSVEDSESRRHESSPEELLMLKEDRKILAKAFEVLPKRHSEVFFLRHVGGMKTAEIAEMLGLSPGTVSTYLNSAKNELREALD